MTTVPAMSSVVSAVMVTTAEVSGLHLMRLRTLRPIHFRGNAYVSSRAAKVIAPTMISANDASAM